jgi:hypothetical protein
MPGSGGGGSDRSTSSRHDDQTDNAPLTVSESERKRSASAAAAATAEPAESGEQKKRRPDGRFESAADTANLMATATTNVDSLQSDASSNRATAAPSVYNNTGTSAVRHHLAEEPPPNPPLPRRILEDAPWAAAAASSTHYPTLPFPPNWPLQQSLYPLQQHQPPATAANLNAMGQLSDPPYISGLTHSQQQHVAASRSLLGDNLGYYNPYARSGQLGQWAQPTSAYPSSIRPSDFYSSHLGQAYPPPPLSASSSLEQAMLQRLQEQQLPLSQLHQPTFPTPSSGFLSPVDFGGSTTFPGSAGGASSSAAALGALNPSPQYRAGGGGSGGAPWTSMYNYPELGPPHGTAAAATTSLLPTPDQYIQSPPSSRRGRLERRVQSALDDALSSSYQHVYNASSTTLPPPSPAALPTYLESATSAGSASASSAAAAAAAAPTADDSLPTKRPHLYLPKTLAQPDDKLLLSSHQVLLRHQIEAFQAAEEDTKLPTRGRNKRIQVGQVGIRCRHCKNVPPARRQRGSMYFPHSTMGIYQACQNMSTTHLQCGLCSEMPERLKQQFAELIPSKTTGSLAGRPYWAKSAQDMGLVDTEGGIRFAPN